MRIQLRARTSTAAAVTGLLITAATAGVHAATPDQGERQRPRPTEAEIRDLFTEWNDAVLTGDPGEVADRYAADAVLEPTQSNQIRTDREGIVDYFEHFLAQDPSGEINESHVEILGPNAAVDSGAYTFHLTNPQTGEPFDVAARYTFVYERDARSGEWLIVNHHSSAMPEGRS
ncbi:SgcJ/EcaC family oxidoreductase [Streptomyces litchfieldiae]|uniref:SgcJ/EcaC family oxidoreductase n=1 Tax=Streptomyces litchfieldiae TaxID=3075543 RepID=A0ABU2MLA5_9ACTN|nr:SgcJ/EcaC family oxidoreductase [Streptomyces sp. DSM 44938]MDT0342270.1 SgcJ/EcaC family oxidoreductase [Streptomyces sp. DSM 44938]